MHHKLLMGSSALVSAGVLLGSATAIAQEAGDGMVVTLTGYTEFGVNWDAVPENMTGNPNQGYGAFMDTEIHVLANAVSDSGVEYGGKVELEVYSGRQGNSGTSADEASIFASGQFGRVELGRDDGAEDVMFVGGEDVQAGTGGIDGDTTNLVQFQVQDSGDSAKISYFTPRVGGFQLGASWGPDQGDLFGDKELANGNSNYKNPLGVGANWTGELAALELTVAAVGYFAEAFNDDDDDIADWSVGFTTEILGAALGAAYGMSTEANEADFANVGLGYGFGPVNASLGYVWTDPEGGTDQNLIAISGDVGILPGLVFKADATYNTDEIIGEDDDGNDITDGEWAAVATVQLNY